MIYQTRRKIGVFDHGRDGMVSVGGGSYLVGGGCYLGGRG